MVESYLDKAEIEGRLNAAGLETSDRDNYKRVKFFVHKLYVDDLDSRIYMIRKICEKDCYIAAKCIVELNNSECKNTIYEFIEQNKINALTKIQVYFILHNFFGFKKAMEEVDESVIEAIITGLIESISDEQYLELVQWIFESNQFEPFLGVINNITRNVPISRDNIPVIEEINDYFIQHKRYYALFLFIKNSFTFERYYNYFDSDINSVFDQLDQQTDKDTTAVKFELAKAFYPKNPMAMQIFRSRSMRNIQNNICDYYASVLLECIEENEISEESLAQFNYLLRFELTYNEKLESKDLLIYITRLLNLTIDHNGDPGALLEILSEINICSDIENTIPYGYYGDLPKYLIEEAKDKLRRLISDCCLEDICHIYFNSPYKLIIRLREFFYELLRGGYEGNDINGAISNYYIKCKLYWSVSDNYMSIDAQNLYLGLSRFIDNERVNVIRRREREFYYVNIKIINNNLNKIMIDEIYEESLFTEINSKRGKDNLQLWEEVLRIAIDKKYSKTQYRLKSERLLKNCSMVSIKKLKSYDLTNFFELLEALADDVSYFDLVMKSVSWSRYFWRDTAIAIDIEYKDYESYNEICVKILKKLKDGGLHIDRLTNLYFNSIFKIIISIEQFADIMQIENYSALLYPVSFVAYYPRENSNEFRINGIKSERLLKGPAKQSEGYIEMFNLHKYYKSSREFIVSPVFKSTENIQIGSAEKRFATISNTLTPNKDIYANILKVPVSILRSDEREYRRITAYFISAVMLRRNDPGLLKNMIAGLEGSNPFSALEYPAFQYDFIADFKYDWKDWKEGSFQEYTKDIVDAVIRNSEDTDTCIYLYINTHIKQYYVFEDFIKLALNRGLPLKRNGFVNKMKICGRIISKDGGQQFVPMGVKFNNNLSIKQNHTFNKEAVYGTELNINFESGIFRYEIDKIIELDEVSINT